MKEKLTEKLIEGFVDENTHIFYAYGGDVYVGVARRIAFSEKRLYITFCWLVKVTLGQEENEEKIESVTVTVARAVKNGQRQRSIILLRDTIREDYTMAFDLKKVSCALSDTELEFFVNGTLKCVKSQYKRKFYEDKLADLRKKACEKNGKT